MKISVIITVYNLERYIEEAIKSVLSQTYDLSLVEIIIVDDCSTDKSADIIKSFKSVKYIKTKTNVGVLLATVAGMRMAQGEVIAFLDGDDVWHQEKLSRVAKSFSDDSSLVFLTHNYQYINEDGEPRAGLEYTQKIYSQLVDRNEISELIVDNILHRRNNVWLGSAYSIRINPKTMLDYFKWVESLPNPRFTYQDWPLAFWIAASGSGTFGYVSEVLFLYRIHSANFSGDSDSREKAIRNWSKGYFTSLSILNIAERFSCDESVLKVCRSYLLKDEFILRLFQNPKSVRISLFLKNWSCFGSFRQAIKELIRLLLIKWFSFRGYFFFKKMLRN